jgi:shikimate kinase
MDTLQLAGMKHTGKSSLGRLWADRHGWTFYDLDTLLEDGTGKSSRQLYLDEGKEGFQRREAEAATRVAPMLEKGRAVLAWGGGTATNQRAVAALRHRGVIVALIETVEVLYERIMKGGRPAFLSAESPREDFQWVYQERTALLTALTPWHLDLDGVPVAQAYARLEAFWNTIRVKSDDPHTPDQ